jgi:hypothetical protein
LRQQTLGVTIALLNRTILDEINQRHIADHISELGNNTGDTLLAAQRIMANLADAPSQEEALSYAVQVFTDLTQPQRLTLLRTVRTHLERSQYDCLAVVPNRLIVENVLNRIETEMTRKTEVSWPRRPKEIHGNPEEITAVTTLIAEIRAMISFETMPVPENHFQPSTELIRFFGTLTDRQFSGLIYLVKEMRDVKACRKRFHSVVDEHFMNSRMGIADEMTMYPKLLNNGDFELFLRSIKKSLLAEIVAMDFQELTKLEESLEELRRIKYAQGRVR